MRVDELISTIGVEAAAQLSAEFGGVPIYIPLPRNMTSSHRIAAVIGIDAARKLAAEWPGFDALVPKCTSELRRERNKAIREDALQLSVRSIALKYRMSIRNVQKIFAGASPQRTSRKAKQR